MEEYSKERGILILKKDSHVMKNFQTTAFIKEVILQVNHLVLADTLGPMANFMKVSGKMGSSMVLVCGEEPKETLTLENGNLARLMDMEFTLG